MEPCDLVILGEPFGTIANQLVVFYFVLFLKSFFLEEGAHCTLTPPISLVKSTSSHVFIWRFQQKEIKISTTTALHTNFVELKLQNDKRSRNWDSLNQVRQEESSSVTTALSQWQALQAPTMRVAQSFNQHLLKDLRRPGQSPPLRFLGSSPARQ